MDWGSLYALSIGGVNRTADSLGSGYVDRELDAAAVAEVRVRGAMPAVGAAVSISGIVAAAFAGVVDRVQYDPAPDQRCWVVRCTDNLQGYFEALGAASVAAGNHVSVGVVAALPTGAYWHEALFSDAADGWEACQDAMQCCAASIWLSGGVLQSATWGPGTATAISHAAGSIYDGSVRLDQAGVRELVSEVVLSIDIRYTRLHQWVHSFGWGGPGLDFCTHYGDPINWPTREMILDTCNGNTWGLLVSGGLSGGENTGVSAEGLWPSGSYQCGAPPAPVVWMLTEGADRHVMNASWKMGRRWAQSIREQYTITVSGTGALGSPEIDGFGHEWAGDDGWDASVPSTVLPAFAVSGGWQTESAAHKYCDLFSAPERTALLQAAVRMAAVRIRRTQRRSTLTVTVLPAQEPGLGTWAAIAADTVAGQGQVARLVARWDFDSHQAGCEVSIALSEGTMAADALTPPGPPDVTPSSYVLGLTTALGTHLGGKTGAPVQDDDWGGWVGNYQAKDFGAEVYTEGFTLVTPDVPDEAREMQVGTVTASYSIDPLDGPVAVIQPVPLQGDAIGQATAGGGLT